jgi:cell division protein FtsW (lipid II flippase)
MLLKEQPLLEKNEVLKKPSIFLVLLLTVLMLATRADHFGTSVSLPDASLAVFFLAGFYLHRVAGFILLCVLAAVIDYWAITARGVSGFCVTAAYGFLLPAYLSVWLAGRWTSKNTDNKVLLISVTVVSVLVAFLISNGSFYLLSGHFTELSMAEYISRVARYLPPYLVTPLGYLSVIALFNFLLKQKKWSQRHCHE